MKSFKKFQNQILTIRLKDHFYSHEYSKKLKPGVSPKLQKAKNDMIVDFDTTPDALESFLIKIDYLKNRLNLVDESISNWLSYCKEFFASLASYVKDLEDLELSHEDFKETILRLKNNLRELQKNDTLLNRFAFDSLLNEIVSLIEKVVFNMDTVYNEDIINECMAMDLLFDDGGEYIDSSLLRQLIERLERIGFSIDYEEPENSFTKFIVASLLDEMKAKSIVVDEVLMHLKNIQKRHRDTSKVKADNLFSVLEWATIFYYAYESKLLPKTKTKKKAIEEFIETHKIVNTFPSFKNTYYKVVRRINEANNYSVDKLKKIIPFMQENYPQTVTKIRNDMEILEEEQSNNE